MNPQSSSCFSTQRTTHQGVLLKSATFEIIMRHCKKQDTTYLE
ncbi:UNVERIFIED_CONTAM: hypothetical protein GTU68_008355 [Idotea baltica]|nr:hypothetical protein [Idotea baltica]